MGIRLGECYEEENQIVPILPPFFEIALVVPPPGLSYCLLQVLSVKPLLKRWLVAILKARLLSSSHKTYWAHSCHRVYIGNHKQDTPE
jgi:ABC-type molybdate transport system permease subunit